MSIRIEPFLPLACVPDAIPAADREAHFQLVKRLLIDSAPYRESLPNGYAFRFDSDSLETVATFVSNERRCCPFMRFEIVVEPTSKGICLRMTRPEGTLELIDAELGLANCCSTSCGCGASVS